MYIYACVNMHLHKYVCTHMCMYVRMKVHKYSTHMCMYVRMKVHKYSCKNTRAYTVYILLHIRTCHYNVSYSYTCICA